MAEALLERTIDKLNPSLSEYNLLRPKHMEHFNYEYINQMLNYAGKDYLTACKNHVVLNISGRVGKAFKLFFKALPQKFKAEDCNKARRYFMRRMSREAGPKEEEDMWNSLKLTPTTETKHAVSQ